MIKKCVSIQGTMCLGSFDTALSTSVDIFVGFRGVGNGTTTGEKNYTVVSDDLIIKTFEDIFPQ